MTNEQQFESNATTIPSEYHPQSTEKKWHAIWESKNIFKIENSKSKKGTFSLVLPPPNVTGVLHMGHAFGTTIQDICCRYERMSGKNVLWIPGTDHAGIATQTAVQRNLLSKGINHNDLSRDAFIDHIWEWKNKHEPIIHSQLKELGLSLNWDMSRFTLDLEASNSVAKAFSILYDKGLIYQGNYLVNWDPIAKTAIADDEVEHEEQHGFLWTISYKVQGLNESVSIATTRPETMIGDTALIVHPDDDRYKHLHGKLAVIPLINRTIPIIPDSYVDREFGTGVVKVTPAHDPNDYEIGLRHDLKMINIMNENGTINSVYPPLQGKTMLEARSSIVSMLQLENAIVEIKPHLNRIGKSYRSKAIIEPYLSKQWFLKMSAFKQELRQYVEDEKIEIVPATHTKTYFHWIDNVRDWCISRQLVWGHRIPVWKHKLTGEIAVSESISPPKRIMATLDEWIQDEDVLDTWFSSALWPFSTLGWPEKSDHLTTYFPNSLLVTGHDILFFWVARMILMSHILCEKIPFKKVYIHGLIYGKSYWKETSTKEIEYITKDERASLEGLKKLP